MQSQQPQRASVYINHTLRVWDTLYADLSLFTYVGHLAGQWLPSIEPCLHHLDIFCFSVCFSLVDRLCINMWSNVFLCVLVCVCVCVCVYFMCVCVFAFHILCN